METPAQTPYGLQIKFEAAIDEDQWEDRADNDRCYEWIMLRAIRADLERMTRQVVPMPHTPRAAQPKPVEPEPKTDDERKLMEIVRGISDEDAPEALWRLHHLTAKGVSPA